MNDRQLWLARLERKAWVHSSARTDDARKSKSSKSDESGDIELKDGEHWVTINGSHVLIGGDGRIVSGAEGKLNDVQKGKLKETMPPDGTAFHRPNMRLIEHEAELKNLNKQHRQALEDKDYKGATEHAQKSFSTSERIKKLKGDLKTINTQHHLAPPKSQEQQQKEQQDQEMEQVNEQRQYEEGQKSNDQEFEQQKITQQQQFDKEQAEGEHTREKDTAETENKGKSQEHSRKLWDTYNDLNKQWFELKKQGAKANLGYMQKLKKQSDEVHTEIQRLNKGESDANPESSSVSGSTSTAGSEAVSGGPGELRGGDGGVEASSSANSGNEASEEPLKGLPAEVTVPGHGKQKFGPLPAARQAARDYMEQAGLPYNPPTDYVKVDPERAKKIAAAYDEMKDDPTNPEVKAAYDAMAKETLAQWEAIKKTGLKIDFIDLEKTGDPYAASPRLAQMDVEDNNHLWVFPTEQGYGSATDSTGFDSSNNPMLAPTKETINGHKMLVNDVFRIVHDYFGHFKEGVGFRADGEENAWRSHSAMYSPLARKAMTSETRGQNSWVNYGPYGEANRTASGAETHFADQKLGLLPDWAVHEGSGGLDLPEEAKVGWVKDALDSGRYDLDSEKRPDKGYGDSYAVKMTPKMPKSGERYSSRGEKVTNSSPWYDKEIAAVNQPPEEGGYKPRAQVKLNPNSGYVPRIEEIAKPKEGVLYRGMSAEEYDSIKKTGEIKSKGGYNLGGEQEGLTYYSTDPSQAESYANSFTPLQFKPSGNKNSYIVAIKDPGTSKNVAGTGDNERGIPGKITKDQILDIFEGRAYAGDTGSADVLNENNKWGMGSASAPTSRVGWKKIGLEGLGGAEEGAKVAGEVIADTAITVDKQQTEATPQEKLRALMDTKGRVLCEKIFGHSKSDAIDEDNPPDHDIYELRAVSINSLIPLQKYVDGRNKVSLMLIRRNQFETHPQILKDGNNLYILDGHHRLTTEFLEGKNVVNVALAECTNNVRADAVASVGAPEAAGILCIGENGRILLGQRADYGNHPLFWGVFGGHREPGEPLEATARREVLEETGYSPQGEIQLIAQSNFNGTIFTYFLSTGPCFEAELNPEHVAYDWFAMGELPEPRFPDLDAILELPEVIEARKRKMNETDTAKAMALGALPSPQKFANMSLYKMRITGTGTSFRKGYTDQETGKRYKDEHVYRRPENYLNADFLERCYGLPVIWEHPNGKVLDSEEFHERIIGSIVVPYIQGDEVWGIARVYDEDAILLLDNERLSTSPAVVFLDSTVNSTIPLNDGSQLLIEGNPGLLDHLAVCEIGVWDKNGPPTGIESETVIVDSSKPDGA